MGNRSRTEIVGNILDAANGGETKTKIMYLQLFVHMTNIIIVLKIMG
jgi:predicted transcriptional regulator